MNDEIIEVAISEIRIGRRFRKACGDVAALARQIERGELLQPIGVTEDLKLVFGERRLRAYRDVLRRDTIPARIVDPRSQVFSQMAENAIRKDYTSSEKVEVVNFLRGYQHGGDRRSNQVRNSTLVRLTIEEAARRAGLKNRYTYVRAKAVVEMGVPELVKALDAGEISLSGAAELASLGHELQRSMLADRLDWTAKEIASIKQRPEISGDGSIVVSTPSADGSDGPEEEPDDEPSVQFEMVPVVEQEQSGLVDSPNDPTDEGGAPHEDGYDEGADVESERDDYNFCPTPSAVTEALLEVEDFGSEVWEPACGDGAISEVLIKHGYEVVSSDIVDRGYGEVEDFFESDRTAESVVTNPDYDYSEEFVRTALERATYKVAMLLPLGFLTSKGRYELLTGSPLKRVYVFTGRVTLRSPDQRKSEGNGRENYAWFVWEHGYEGDPAFHLLHPDVCDEFMKNDEERPRPKHPARQVG